MRVARGRSVAGTLLGAALVVVLVALAAAAPAGAATYETSVSPDPFSFPETERLVYRLHITTGGQSERVGVSARPPSFPAGDGEFLALDAMVLEGAGTVVSRGGGFGHWDRFCGPLLADAHGSNVVSSPFMEVEIPADSASAVALPARPYTGLGYAPWLGMDLAVEFRLGPRFPENQQQIVRSPSPANGGRHGVRISLGTDPQGVPGGCPEGFTPVDFGKEILVSGRADTAVAGQLMTIRAVRSESAFGGGFSPRRPLGEPVELARVRIAADGTFAYRWQPAQPGEYTLGALYQSQSPKFAEDFSIPVNLRVGQPRRICASIRARLACSPIQDRSLLSLSVRGRRRGSVIVSRARGALRGTGRSCSGKIKLRIRSGSKRVGVRDTRLNKSCRWSKRYAIAIRRLPPRQRRRLANRKPVTLTVTARLQSSHKPSARHSPSRAYRINP